MAATSSICWPMMSSSSSSSPFRAIPAGCGRDNLIELYRGYQSTFFLDRCFDLRVHRSDDSTVTLEYASEGKVTATGRPYGNRYISVVTSRTARSSTGGTISTRSASSPALEDANTTDA